MNCPSCGAAVAPDAMACPSCGSALAAQDPAATSGAAGAGSPALAPGTRLQNGAFVVEAVLGQGGFGITYRGADTNLRRAIAIKEFFPFGSQRLGATVAPASMTVGEFSTARQGFVGEAMTLARFNHIGIVRVFGVFEENSTAYMVMELLDGHSLQQRLDGWGAMPEAEVLAVAAQVGAALSAVHGAQLLHRDIKPDNIVLTSDGRVVLIDFGTAREFAQDKTRLMTALVTHGYAPLEQYGRQAKFGPFTDVYALGATLYHCLTGQLPTSALDRVSGTELLAPSVLNPRVSPTVSQSTMRAMALQSADRFQSVSEFVHALHGAQAAPQVLGAPPTVAVLEPPRLVAPVAAPANPPAAPGSNSSKRRMSPTLGVAGVAGVACLLLALAQRQPAPSGTLVGTPTASAEASPQAPGWTLQKASASNGSDLQEFPEVRSRLLVGELSSWPLAKVQGAIEETLAWHGLPFDSKSRRARFVGRSWYRPDASLVAGGRDGVEEVRRRLGGREKQNFGALIARRSQIYEAQVAQRYKDWERAWREHSLSDLKKFYSPEVQVRDAEDPAPYGWDELMKRREKLLAEDSTFVALGEPELQVSGGEVTLTVRRSLQRSDGSGYEVTKTLLWSLTQNQWLIEKERADGYVPLDATGSMGESSTAPDGSQSSGEGDDG